MIFPAVPQAFYPRGHSAERLSRESLCYAGTGASSIGCLLLYCKTSVSMEVAGAGGDSAAEGAESKHTHTHINTTQAGDSRINHTAFTLPTRLSYRRRGENKGVRDPEGQGARGEGRHPPAALKPSGPPLACPLSK